MPKFKLKQRVYIRADVVGGDLAKRPRVTPVTAAGEEHKEGSIAMSADFIVPKKSPRRATRKDFECQCGLPAVFSDLTDDMHKVEIYCEECLLKKLTARVTKTANGDESPDKPVTDCSKCKKPAAFVDCETKDRLCINCALARFHVLVNKISHERAWEVPRWACVKRGTAEMAGVVWLVEIGGDKIRYYAPNEWWPCAGDKRAGWTKKQTSPRTQLIPGLPHKDDIGPIVRAIGNPPEFEDIGGNLEEAENALTQNVARRP